MPVLDWIGKEKVVAHHLDVPCRELKKAYQFGDDPGNMIVHGDNLEALKSLLPRFEGRVRCIYIDPPYNTGNEKWVYNDNMTDPKIARWLGQVVGREGEDFTRHDKWLCMMYPRLRLLHKLLSDDGAIFISIDDNELYHLKLICDEIFGAAQFIAQVSWFKKASPSNDAQFFSNDIEYILIYAKKKSIWRPNKLPLNFAQLRNYQNPDNDPRGDWNSATYTCNKSKEERPNLYYGIQNPNNGEIVFPKVSAVWKYSQEQTEIYQSEKRLFWGVDGKAKMPRIKKFLSEHEGVVNRTLWHYDDVNHTQGATTELKEIFGGASPFDTPKPTRLIERVLQIATDKDSLVLDSFAGSGTTAQAVLSANARDGGNRRFILVELNDYAESVTAERVRRVIAGYGEGKNAHAGAGGGFGYYELGEPYFLNGEVNPAASPEALREYVWFAETRTPFERPRNPDNPWFLGVQNGLAYYLYHLPDRSTCLDRAFLSTISVPAEGYVIFAARCALDEEFMCRHNITFKKIPRDVPRV